MQTSPSRNVCLFQMKCVNYKPAAINVPMTRANYSKPWKPSG